MFKKYANTGYNLKSNTFDGVKSTSKKISITNLWSFRRDFLEGMINKRELTQLITMVNFKIMKKR